jgi:nicotinamidase-related amidase
MPLSQIDPVAALVVIDMQKGIVGLPTAHPMAGIVEKIARLTSAFRAAGQPVVLVNVTGLAPGRNERKFNFQPPADWTELIPELDAQPGDHLVTKMQVGAFRNTGLDDLLRKAGATQAFVVGVATGSGVESTARAAYDHGYNVVLVTDAMTDMDAEVHRHSVEKTFPRIGETTTTDQVLVALKA